MPRLAAIVITLIAGAASLLAQEPQAIPPVPPLPPPFSEWLDAVRDEAATRGIRPEVIEQAFTGIEPVEQILERD